jgi:large subunit ribosomal protein L23
MKINSVILKPVITEKTTRLSQEKVYAFQVNTNANKHMVAETVEKLYGVEVESVRMMTRKGKEKRVGRKMKTKQMPDKKVALIRVKKGTIDLFPQS